MQTRRRPLLVVAIALDAVVVVLLVVACLISTFGSTFTGVLVGALDAPIVLVAAAVSGAALITGARTRRRRAAAWVVSVALTLGAVPLGLGAIAAASDLNLELGPNPARDAAHRVGAVIEADGGHRLCAAGDPGLGPDNVQPWYAALYDAPADPGLRQRLVDHAEADGLEISKGGVEPRAGRAVLSLRTGLHEDVGACGYGTEARAAAGRQLVRLQVQAPPND